MSIHTCSMCSFIAPSKSLLLSHLRAVHCSDPRFSANCGINGCGYVGRSFSSLYSHIYRNHKTSDCIERRSGTHPTTSYDHGIENFEICARDSNFHSYLDDSNLQQVSSHSEGNAETLTLLDHETQKRTSALFLLKLKEVRHLSQVAIDDVVEAWDHIFGQHINYLCAKLKPELTLLGVDITHAERLVDTLASVPSPFLGLETRYKQDKYFNEKLGLVEPQEIKIGNAYYKTCLMGSKRKLIEVYDTYQYVPILQTLQALLSDNDVFRQVQLCPSRRHTNGILEDFCDGNLFNSHSLFSRDPYTLQVIAFYDEIELCNPLGSHVKKHKMGVVLFTLGNIHPKYRSSLRIIQLAIAATVPVIQKHGLDEILKPFIHDLKILCDDGVTVSINGEEKKFNGALLCFLADNLGSHSLGGFKESFSFAVRLCRTCNATKDDVYSSFNEADCTLRSDVQHLAQCSLLHGPMSSHYSKTYGINRRSSLIDIPLFSMFNGGLPHDCMHDLLEGVALHEMNLLLTEYIVNRGLITLDVYNQNLMNFDYGYTESDKPPEIAILSSNRKLRMSASQTLLLLRILPLLLGPHISEEDKYWRCFLSLLKITDIVLCPVVSKELVGYLKLLIMEHHTAFTSLYGKSELKPKFHYLIHYPSQILMLGPMVRTWNMRNEAKLSVFKRASHLGNFKNISHSLASRHQRLLCYELSGCSFLNSGIECGPCRNSVVFSSLPDHIKNELKILVPMVTDDIIVLYPSWVKKDGMNFKLSNCYLLKGTHNLCPTFAEVKDILLISDNLIFHVHHYHTDYYDDHFHSYVLTQSVNKSFLSFSDLKYHCILHAHSVNGAKYVYLKWYFTD